MVKWLKTYMENMKSQSILWGKHSILNAEYMKAQSMRNYYVEKKMEIARELRREQVKKILAVVKKDYTPELEKRGL